MHTRQRTRPHTWSVSRAVSSLPRNARTLPPGVVGREASSPVPGAAVALEKPERCDTAGAAG